MSTNIYISGCTTCGTNAAYIARVKSVRENVNVYNTRYDGSVRLSEHIEYLKQAGMEINQYHSIVVEEGRVTLLKEWLA